MACPITDTIQQQPFIQDDRGEPVPEEAFTHSHPAFVDIVQHR